MSAGCKVALGGVEPPSANNDPDYTRWEKSLPWGDSWRACTFTIPVLLGSPVVFLMIHLLPVIR
jgi:hypothetical protein